MKRLLLPALTSALVLFFISCASPTTSTPASTTVSGFAKGLITAKGSIWVNGVEYDTTSATPTEDGTTAAAGDDSGLKVGMTVSLKGTINTATGKGTATTVNYESSLKGTATAFSATTAADPYTGSFLVFGQTVKTTFSTVFEGGTVTTLTALAALTNPFVEVSGQLDASGILVANRVEYKTVADPFKLRGTVSLLTPSASGGTFSLTTEESKVFTVTYTGTLDAAIVNGSDVRVLFTAAPSGTAVTATSVKLRPAELQGADGDRIEIDGIISSYNNSPSVTFTLDGRSISATAAVVAAAGTIGNGTKVEVKGKLSGGVVAASSITTKNEPNLEAKGLVTAVNVAASTFTVGTVVLHVNNLTIFHDPAWKGTNPLSTLLTTDNVSVKYYADAAVPSVNQAVRVERQ